MGFERMELGPFGRLAAFGMAVPTARRAWLAPWTSSKGAVGCALQRGTGMSLWHRRNHIKAGYY